MNFALAVLCLKANLSRGRVTRIAQATDELARAEREAAELEFSLIHARGRVKEIRTRLARLKK